MRVNARLDAESAEQVEYLMQATNAGVSQVLRESVALYYEKVRARRSGGLLHFARHIGSGDSGRSDTASNWKEAIAEAMDEKYPQHAAESTPASPSLLAERRKKPR